MVLRKYNDDLDALGDSLRLWRYMSFDKFVHLLATETLWLAPLSSMEDKREGKWIDVQTSGYQDQYQDRAHQNVIHCFKHAETQTVVSSWIAVEEELLPMWNFYASTDTGIAISTDVHSLLSTLSGKVLKDAAFFLMRVEYCDEPHPILVTPGVFSPFCAKYKSSDFQHENEVRVVYMPSMGTTSTPSTSGGYFKINSIHALAKYGVVVSPRANPWWVETVKSVMGNYGHDPALVRPSDLTPNFATPSSPPFQHNITY